MSLKYEILKMFARLIGPKKFLTGGADELVEKMKRENAKNKIPKLVDAEIEIAEINVGGFPVLKMIHKQKTDKAGLYIIGGGMIRAPHSFDIKTALRIAKESGLDLYVPFYPLCTDYPITRAFEMIHETYKVMLENYAAKNISALGTSAGGFLALGIPAYINAQKSDAPMPGRIVAVSPGACAATDEEWKAMLALDKADMIIPARFMKTMETVMRHGTEVPDYMIFLQKGDFTNCPDVTFMYGTDEVLFAVASSFEDAMKKYGVNYRMIVGEGMFHCYPVFPICEEAKRGWDQLIRILKEG